MSYTPIRRSSKPLKRTRIKAKPRPAAETARIYGTPEHRAWMKRQPCFWCGAGPSDAAHIRSGGTSRKGDWQETLPMCVDRFGLNGCHTQYDNAKQSFPRKHGHTRESLLAAAKECAQRYESTLRTSHNFIAEIAE